jgi:hypothetical protein
MARLIYSAIASLDGYVAAVPVLVGGGKRALSDGLRLELEPLAERRFVGGVVHLHFRVRS